MLALDDVESADAGSDMYAHPFFIFRSDLQAGGFKSFIGSGDGKVNEPRHLLDFFFLDVLQRVETFDFGRNLAGEAAHIETCDALHPRLTGKQGLPHVLRGITHSANQSKASDYDPASQL